MLGTVEPPVRHPMETVQACLARSEPSGAQPSLEDLDRKLEGTMKAIDQLARSEENTSELGKQWNEYVRKAEKDMIDHGVDAAMDGFLGVTKTTLEVEKEALKEPLEASMKDAQRLRWEYQATAGFGAPNPVVQQRIADYKKNAQALLERDGALREHLEDLEQYKDTVEHMKSGKEFGEWLIGEEPCKRQAAGNLNCEALKKENGVAKFLQGDTETQAELLKKVMDFGVHYSPTIKLLAHGNLIVDTWDIGSLVIDLGYDASVLYAANNAAKQMSQVDAKMGQARATLNARIERLNAEIACYRQADTGTKTEAAR
jgi:prefoldin subunit 5